MSEDAAKIIVGLLLDALQTEAKKHLPSYVQSSWLDALSSVVEQGLYHSWVGIIEGKVLRIEAGEVEIIDNRTGDGVG